MQTRAKDFFDSYAESFHLIYGNKSSFFGKLGDRLFRRSMYLRYVQTLEGCDPVQGKTVVDIGCGPGVYAIALAKRGAAHVCGVDFSKAMISLAKQKVKNKEDGRRCKFIFADFMTYPFADKFDYAVAMGFMDYVQDAKKVVERILSLTREKAFFSFPDSSGLLAWQRKMRYSKKCPLFMYSEKELHALFRDIVCKEYQIKKISRDFFVTVNIAA